MKAITIQQPYAQLITAGEKFVENRTWGTQYRGWLGIHAGKSRVRVESTDTRRFPDMAFGALVAIAFLETCLTPKWIHSLIGPHHELAWLRRHRHVEGPYCFVLTKVYPLTTPIAMPGAQRLWELDPAIVEQARALRTPEPLKPGIEAATLFG